ncbi:MAG: hypothetical protein IPP42_07430 [Saprospiraceae bacterium]|nr:hypothetical protein [Saprospiraceae bacterium]
MVALDIFIGLVLIYFLYSLLASIIAEMISTWIGMRARMLRQGIENLLNDKQPVKVANEAYNIFYSQYWAIKSWNERLNFAWNTLIYSGFSGWFKDAFLIECRGFRYSTAGRFYKEPTIKYMAKVGDNAMYSTRHTKPAYITKENFTLTVLNMISQRSQGINEWEKIKFGIKYNAMALEPETLKMFQDWVARANDSYENFITNVERTYVEMMDRVNGWYKRKIGLFIFWIGFIICVIMNVDTLEIVKILSNDPEKRKQMVELAKQTIEAREAHQNTPNDVQNKELYELLRSELDSTKAIIDKSKTIMANGWGNMTTSQILNNSMPWNGNKFWGFLITALALSLGSQFWYDLLKKLVEIRGAGVKPEERSDELKEELEIKKKGNDGLKLLTKDPVQIAISENREYWESLPGFISVNEDLNNENKKVVKLTFEKEKLPRNLNPIIVKNDSVEIKTIFGKKGVLQNSEPTVKKGMIHQPYFGTWGTPSGIVFNTKTNRHAILSCGHVIRSEYTSFIDPGKSEIEMYIADGNSQIIGNAHYLVMSSYCDAGLIDTAISPSNLENIYGISKIEKCRKVNYSENGKTKVIIH